MTTPQPRRQAQQPYQPWANEDSGWDRQGGAAWSGQAPPPVPGTNGLAIASLVLGALWLFWIGSLLAVVFGHIALHQIRRSHGWQQGRGLAIAGVVLGWVGIAVLALIIVVGLVVAEDTDSIGDAGSSPDDIGASRPGAADAPDTTPTSTAHEYSRPEQADEVLARGAPEVAPPPAGTPADVLETETLIEGEGNGAAVGDTVVVHYVGALSDGTVFDQSWQRGEPFQVTLGTGQVIAGWEEGLVGVKVGERRRLVIGADNAYGGQGAGQIPANSPLAFVVDVVDIQ